MGACAIKQDIIFHVILLSIKPTTNCAFVRSAIFPAMSIQLLLPQAAHSVLVVAKQSIAKHLLYMYSSITLFLAKMFMYHLLKQITKYMYIFKLYSNGTTTVRLAIINFFYYNSRIISSVDFSLTMFPGLAFTPIPAALR